MSKTYFGKKVKEKKLVQAKSRIIDPDEELICVIRGRIKVRGGIALGFGGKPKKGPTDVPPPAGLLFITSKRAIFYYKLLLGRYEQIIFPYKLINTVSHYKGFGGEEINLQSMGDNITIGYIPEGDGRIAVEYVNEFIKEAKLQKVEVVSGGTNVDIIGQIEKLGDLKEKGLITEEEFESKKAELLERL